MTVIPQSLGRRLCVAAPGDPEQRVLVSGLDLPPWSELVWRSPLRDPRTIERALAAGELDAAVLPIDAVARAEDRYELIPGLAAGCSGSSGVMLLVHQGPLEELERIVSLARGHAAETLARLLFAAAGREIPLDAPPETREDEQTNTRPECADDKTALLLTGSRALVDAPRWVEHGWTALDLGHAWHRLTGRPFVWAAWAVHPNTVTRRLYGVLHGARTRGKHRMGEIIETLAEKNDPQRAHIETVLSRWVRYRLGTRELASIRHFWDEAARCGLLPERAVLRLLPLAAGSACRTPPNPR